MRRILCLLMALCLFPLAVFAESTPQPSAASSFMNRSLSAVGPISTATPVPPEEEKLPMDAFDFLERYLFALNLLGLDHLGYNCTYAVNEEDREAYLVMDHLLLTLTWEPKRSVTDKASSPPIQRVTHVDCFYKDAEGLAPMASALIFAASGASWADELQYFKHGLTELSKYQDQESAQALIRSLTTPVPKGDYLAWDDGACFSLIFNDPALHPVSHFYSRTDLVPYETDGVNLYEFLTKYVFASRQLSGAPFFHKNFSQNNNELPTYHPLVHTAFYVHDSSMDIYRMKFRPMSAWKGLTKQRYQLENLIASLFALSHRSIEEELAAAPEDRFIPLSNDLNVWSAAILKIIDAKKIGNYSLSTYHFNSSRCSFYALIRGE